MADRELQEVLRKLKSSKDYSESSRLLSKAKISLLKLNALTPTSSTPKPVLLAAREVFETGALISIRAKDPDAFTRYVNQLQPFYDLPASVLSGEKSEKAKITGLYLLLLLMKGDYAGFHTELEGLEMRLGEKGGDVESDKYLSYPVKLERWLMEGSYDRVWKAMASREVPSEEYAVFSEVLSTQIRSEIASCSERAYPSLPISSTKNLLFLDSEGAVVSYAQSRGWVIKDGRIYFPVQQDGGALAEGEGEKELSQMAIENTLGYARELETIV